MSTEGSADDQGVAIEFVTAQVDLDSDGESDWTAIRLVAGSSAPLDASEVWVVETGDDWVRRYPACWSPSLDPAGDCLEPVEPGHALDVGHAVFVRCFSDPSERVDVLVAGVPVATSIPLACPGSEERPNQSTDSSNDPASEPGASENAAVRATMGDADGDGRNDHIKILLVRGDHAPYRWIEGAPSSQEVHISGSSMGGNFSIQPSTYGVDDSTNPAVCTTLPTSNAADTCASEFGATGNDQAWDVGQTLYVACIGSTPQSISVAVRDTAVFDAQMDCEEAPSS